MFRSYIAHITSKWRLYALKALLPQLQTSCSISALRALFTTPGSRETIVDKIPCLRAYAPSGIRTPDLRIASREREPLHHSAHTNGIRQLTVVRGANPKRIVGGGGGGDIQIPPPPRRQTRRYRKSQKKLISGGGGGGGGGTPTLFFGAPSTSKVAQVKICRGTFPTSETFLTSKQKQNKQKRKKGANKCISRKKEN